jgi:hypothetical protein
VAKRELPSGLKVLVTESSPCGYPVRGGLTDREVALLDEMRGLKEALRDAPPNARPVLAARLEALKALREDARKERMALLGHDS